MTLVGKKKTIPKTVKGMRVRLQTLSTHRSFFQLRLLFRDLCPVPVPVPVPVPDPFTPPFLFLCLSKGGPSPAAEATAGGIRRGGECA